MCGIAGLIDPRGIPADRLTAAATAMGDAIAHRGPDGSGLWCDPAVGIGLAHRRLAIIDTSDAGAQPMPSADGRWVLCYNGEVYNFEEMRAHPALADIAWQGGSDTEVIANSIARIGLAETIEAMNGMFAFVAWDRQAETLHLVRDRMGIKPLFVAADGDRLLFGSELKALRAGAAALGGSVDLGSVDPAAVAAYLRWGAVPAPLSILTGATKLSPGEWATWRPGTGLERRTYWTLDAVARAGRAAPRRETDAEATDALEALLIDAVGRQMIADVPLGAFLSGGVDSSTVAALMVAANKGPVRTFSIGFPDFGFDEAPHAAAVAAHLGTQHTAMTVDGAKALAVIPRLPEMYDEPFADSSQIPTHLVSALTRDHVTVALSGDGGDELFAGYNRHLFAARMWPRLQRIPGPLRRALAWLLTRPSPALVDGTVGRLPGMPPQLGDKLGKIASVLPGGLEAAYTALVAQVRDADRYLTPDARHAARTVPGLEGPADFSPVDRMRFADMTTYLPDDILQKVDRASMAVALEARPPFLDHRVVEHAWALPADRLIRDGRTKWLLRQVLYRHVPQNLIDRPKMGFGVPLAAWLRAPLKEWAGDLLHGADYGGGMLRPEPARALFAEHLSGRRNHAPALWTLLMLEAWRRRWNAPGG